MPVNYQPASVTSVRREAFGLDLDGRGLPLNAWIENRADLNDGLTVLTIRLHNWSFPPFEPGQYAGIALQTRSTDAPVTLSSLPVLQAELSRRYYSIANSPLRTDRIELLINLVPRGRFTPMLWRLDEGDRLHVEPRIRGRFTLESVSRDARLILVASGTGIAPYMSMLRRYSGTGRWDRLALLHTVRHVEDLAYHDEIQALTRRDATISYLPTVTRRKEENRWQGLEERVQHLLEPARFRSLTGFEFDPHKGSHLYLCGNPEMIESVRAQSEALGFTLHRPASPGTLHMESYW